MNTAHALQATLSHHQALVADLPKRRKWQRPRKRKPVEERFLDYFIPEPNSGCWLWLKGLTSSGYGHFWDSRRDRSVLAHRYSYEKYRGPIPDGLFALHKCDVRCCVNPDHLYLGTSADNMADMAARGGRKGRGAGEGNGRAKLTAEQVQEIRTIPLGTRGLSKRFGVSRCTLHRIRTGRGWENV